MRSRTHVGLTASALAFAIAATAATACPSDVTARRPASPNQFVSLGDAPFVYGCAGDPRCAPFDPDRLRPAVGQASIVSGSYSEGAFILGVVADGQIRFGFVDKTGGWIAQPRYVDAKPFCGGLAPVATGEGQWGFVDPKGALVIPAHFSAAQNFAEGLAAVRGPGDKGKWGFVTADGVQAIAPQFDDVGSFSEGLAPYEAGGKWGYVDRAGKVAIAPLSLSRGGDFADGRAIVVKPRYYADGTHSELIDIKGKAVIDNPRYSGLKALGGGLYELQRVDSHRSGDGEVYFLSRIADKDGHVLPTAEFSEIGAFAEGLLSACRADRCGYIDAHGGAVIAAKFTVAADFSEGLGGVVTADEKLGFVDHAGQFVIPARFASGADPIFGRAPAFHQGFASVGCGDHWGVIDRQGRWTVAPVFDGVDAFVNGLARVYVAALSGWRHIGLDGSLIDFAPSEISDLRKRPLQLCGAPLAPGAAFASASADAAK
jgi:hypothetical protein